MQPELEYVKHLKSKYKIELLPKSRFILTKLFQAKLLENAATLGHDTSSVSFRKLKAIEDLDEQHEIVHCLRLMVTQIMMDDSKALKESARIAQKSSVRAYAGHSHEMRHIFLV